MDTSVETKNLVFSYPPILKWAMGLGAVFFIGCFVMSVQVFHFTDPGIWTSFIFLVSGLGAIYYWYRLQARIIVDDQTITYIQFGQSTQIQYSEVSKVRHHFWRQALVIYDSQRKIQIEKQLDRYPFFYAIISEYLPPLTEEYSADLPLKVNVRFWVMGLGGIFIILGLWLLGLVITNPPNELFDQILLILFLAIGPIFLGLTFFSKTLRQYVFYQDRVEVVSWNGREIFLADNLKDMKLESRNSNFQEIRVLRLIFTNGEVQLSDLSISYPLEILTNIVITNYGGRVVSDIEE